MGSLERAWRRLALASPLRRHEPFLQRAVLNRAESRGTLAGKHSPPPLPCVRAGGGGDSSFGGALPGRRHLPRVLADEALGRLVGLVDRKSTRLNSSHVAISYAVFCLKKKKRRSAV